jgi:NADH-quinone oxidoreductase subunit M
MLIPFYFLIGGWGGPGRVKATIKLVIYTLVGSLLMLAAAIALGVLASQQGGGHITFVLSSLQAMPLSTRLAGVDLPVLRRRLPREDAGLPAARLDARRLPRDADRGADGVLRRALEGRRVRLPAIVLPLCPQAAAHFQTLMLLIALASILYGSAMAFTQTNARLIAATPRSRSSASSRSGSSR